MPVEQGTFTWPQMRALGFEFQDGSFLVIFPLGRFAFMFGFTFFTVWLTFRWLLLKGFFIARSWLPVRLFLCQVG